MKDIKKILFKQLKEIDNYVHSLNAEIKKLIDLEKILSSMYNNPKGYTLESQIKTMELYIKSIEELIGFKIFDKPFLKDQSFAALKIKGYLQEGHNFRNDLRILVGNTRIILQRAEQAELGLEVFEKKESEEINQLESFKKAS